MASTKTRAQYQKLYNEKADRLRHVMDLQRANFNDTPGVLVKEVRELDAEMIQLKAAIDALDTVADLDSMLPPVDDRRAAANNEQRLHVMVATVQSTVAELSSVRKRMDDGFDEMRQLIVHNQRLAWGGIIGLVILVMVLLAAGVL